MDWDGIRSKRNNAGTIPKISSDKNKQMIKEIISKERSICNHYFQSIIF
jgi:hypothetical protein